MNIAVNILIYGIIKSYNNLHYNKRLPTKHIFYGISWISDTSIFFSAEWEKFYFWMPQRLFVSTQFNLHKMKVLSCTNNIYMHNMMKSLFTSSKVVSKTKLKVDYKNSSFFLISINFYTFIPMNTNQIWFLST